MDSFEGGKQLRRTTVNNNHNLKKIIMGCRAGWDVQFSFMKVIGNRSKRAATFPYAAFTN